MRYTLLADGPTDAALLPILDWLLRQHLPDEPVDGDCADLRRVPKPPRELTERIVQALDLYPCDVLFIHRDAERTTREARCKEIVSAIKDVQRTKPIPACVRVVPVRMQEAWLLFDEKAIRTAAGNPNGRIALGLPGLQEIEGVPNPKQVLYEALRLATELSARRRRMFLPQQHAHRVAQCIEDFTPLRALSAFQAMERDVRQVVLELRAG